MHRRSLTHKPLSMCGDLNRNNLHRLTCVNAWPIGRTLLGGVALLKEVWHSGGGL